MESDLILFVVIIMTIFWAAVFILKRRGLKNVLNGYTKPVKVASVVTVLTFAVALTSAVCIGIVFLARLVLG